VIKCLLLVKLFDRITEIFYLAILIAYRIKTQTISLVKLGRIEEKIINIFHLDLINFLLCHLICPFLKLFNCERRSNIVS